MNTQKPTPESSTIQTDQSGIESIFDVPAFWHPKERMNEIADLCRQVHEMSEAGCISFALARANRLKSLLEKSEADWPAFRGYGERE